MRSLQGDDPVAVQLRASARKLAGVAVFSGVVNLLTLSGSIYMLQVYDRVIPSRNIATLLGLSAIILIAILLQGYFDALRGRMLARIGALFDAELQPQIYFALVSLPLRGTKPILAQQPLRDLDQVRAFLSGTRPHGISRHAVDSAVFDCTVPFSSGDRCYGDLRSSGHHRHDAADRVSVERRRKDIDRGQCPTAGAGRCTAWECGRYSRPRHDRPLRQCDGRCTNEDYIHHNTRLADVNANLGAAAKVLRFILQSAVLGVGAYLVVVDQASGGIMIASAILMGRALAPVEVALTNWKQLVAAREGISRLRTILKVTAAPAAPAVVLQRPHRSLIVEDLSVVVPGTQRTVVSHLSFGLKAGSGMALLGASAAGKSSLAKALVGIWPAATGSVRLDGAANRPLGCRRSWTVHRLFASGCRFVRWHGRNEHCAL